MLISKNTMIVSLINQSTKISLEKLCESNLNGCQAMQIMIPRKTCATLSSPISIKAPVSSNRRSRSRISNKYALGLY